MMRKIFLILLSPVMVLSAEPKPLRVLVWDEQQPEQKKAYGDRFLGETIAAHLSKQPGLEVKSVSLADPEQGVSEALLDNSDVVIWWAHKRVSEFTEEHARRLVSRVVDGRLSLIALHSAHWSKPFVRLMQERAKSDALAQVPEAERATAKWKYLLEEPYPKVPKLSDPLTPSLAHEGDTWTLTLPACVFPSYRADGAPSHVKTLLPDHPIAAGLPATWDIPKTEMYGEPFHIPTPDAVVFEERWDKGEHFRSGCIWKVGKGRVFYFRPGHETYPVYQQAEPLKVITNAVRWLGAPKS
jgi:trehalose utilization protein